jgi:hypothetical protein
VVADEAAAIWSSWKKKIIPMNSYNTYVATSEACDVVWVEIMCQDLSIVGTAAVDVA